MKTILAAVDFSEISDAVVDQAAALAKLTNGRVILVTVVQPPLITTEYAPFVENIAAIEAAADEAATNRMTSLQKRLANDGIESETVQLNGAPVLHVVNEAKKQNADYIVMGSHGHTSLYDLLVGSTTHGVLLRASCPVVIVPSRQHPTSPASAA